MEARRHEVQRKQDAILGLLCAAVIAIFACVGQSGVLESASPNAKDSYYNLLVQGFRAGHLYVNRDPSAGLAHLANPYDPSLNRDYVWDKDHLAYEMSYYRGRLYLYFGVVPAILLFWPWAALTGHYFPEKDAIVFFMAGGFLVAAGLVRAIWRRYFPELGLGTVAAGMIAMGLAISILPMIACCDVYEVAKSCAFALTILVVAAVWRSLHDRQNRIPWLIAASLAYGLVIGSRPSLLLGAIILLVPVAQAWRETKGREPWKMGGLLAAAVVPITLAGMGLLLYNALRFGNPLEFGLHYQLTSFPNNNAAEFSLNYLWFNFVFYFWQSVQWSVHFPFLHGRTPGPGPAGYHGVGELYAGILRNYPVAWLALFAPLAWKGRQPVERGALRAFAVALLLLFLAGALTLLLFCAAGGEYELDFLPALMLLAVIGIFGLTRALAGKPYWQKLARLAALLSLGRSVLFNFLAIAEVRANTDYMKGNILINQGNVSQAMKNFEEASDLEPNSAEFHFALANALSRAGQTPEAMVQYKKALEIKPDFAEADNNLAYTLLQAGHADEAIVYYQRSITNAPSYQAYYNLGYAFRRNGNAAGAIESYQKAIQLQPTFLPPQIDLSWMLATWPDAAVRDGAQAVAIAQKLNQLAPNDPRILQILAAAYAETGRFPEAIQTANQAMTLARAQSRTTVFNELRAELELYQNHLPCRSPVLKDSETGH